jgi:hypothetical protein
MSETPARSTRDPRTVSSCPAGTAAGVGGVRGQLITVLGDYLLPSGRSAPTSAFIDALGRFGVEEAACRQALIRAAADGWLVAERAGRFTWWRLTPAFEGFLTMGPSGSSGSPRSSRTGTAGGSWW